VHFPRPARRIGPERARARDQPLRNIPNARCERGVRVQLALRLSLVLFLVVSLGGALLDFLLRDEHALLAIDTNDAGFGGLHGLAAAQAEDRDARQRRAEWSQSHVLFPLSLSDASYVPPKSQALALLGAH